jgi:hypothetical protein
MVYTIAYFDASKFCQFKKHTFKKLLKKNYQPCNFDLRHISLTKVSCNVDPLNEKKWIIFFVLLSINYCYTNIKPNFQILNEIKAENNGVGIDQSVTGWTVGVQVPEREKFLFSIASRSALGPTQPLNQWGPDGYYPGSKAAGALS